MAQLASCLTTMKTVVVLACLVAVCLAGTVPHFPEFHHQTYNVKTKPVDVDFVAKQKKILEFFKYTRHIDTEAEYYKIGMEYDIEAHVADYTKKEAVEEFLHLYKTGFVPKYKVFSIFDDRMKREAVALYNLFYFAKDFDTFYKTACWARVHLHEYQFYYTFYIAVYHRTDTKGIVLPAPYEVYTEFFTNMETMFKAYKTKMQDGFLQEKEVYPYGMVKESDYYVYYANYSNFWTYGHDEHKLAYFTEDIGMNSYYHYFHDFFPFWMDGDQYGFLKEHRGERFFYFYQQLLARYYLERLSNGLGEIPDFSWYEPLKYGYTPFLTTSGHPFIQRNDYYYMQCPKNYEDLQFLDAHEKTFISYLQRIHFKAYNQEIDFRNPKAINFIGNYWQGNNDLYEKSGPRRHHPSYEAVARRVLGAGPESYGHNIAPTALEFYMTSLRDPAFYQLYNKIMNYFLQYKEYLDHYTQEQLHYVGVKINDVSVDKLVTFFEHFDHDVTTGVFHDVAELKGKEHSAIFKVRQPRLNHKPFSVNIDVKSEVEGDAVFKIFLGPKYDSHGYPYHLHDNWMNFVELDWFVYKLKSGQNKIERKSEDFFRFKEDSIPMPELYKYIEQGKVPYDMSERFFAAPRRLMLPRGTEGGFPFQLFVFVYPYEKPGKEFQEYKNYLIDAKPLGYPLDRPMYYDEFIQPNMYFKDVSIYFEGPHFPYTYNNPFYVPHKNEVPKH